MNTHEDTASISQEKLMKLQQLLGDVFDVGFKANSKNVDIIMTSANGFISSPKE